MAQSYILCKPDYGDAAEGTPHEKVWPLSHSLLTIGLVGFKVCTKKVKWAL